MIDVHNHDMSIYLIVFGAAVRSDASPSGSLKRRVEGALAFACTISGPKFIATGGLGRFGPEEAVVIADLLVKNGIPRQAILVEDKARDTLESIELCHEILKRQSDVEAIVPCTSPYHVPRCALLFRLLGYQALVAPMPRDRPNLPLWKWTWYVLKEFLATPYDALLLLSRHRLRL
jgi:uncharacterized SAM-binding protein YcdF (DUF218 family)